MNITFKLAVFGWDISTFNVRIDLDEIPSAASPVPPKFMDSVSDYFANRWFSRHSS